MKSESVYFKYFVGCLLACLCVGCNRASDRGSLQASKNPDSASVESYVEMRHVGEVIKERCNAKEVRLGRSYFYDLKGDSAYWLKVDLLNPNLSGRTRHGLEREVACYAVKHLIVPNAITRIEVTVTERTGFIFTFSRSFSAFFNIDSLRTN